MKKYVIFTNDIHPIGGTQMLVAGRAKYLENHDWQVYIFFGGAPFGTSDIPSLTKYISGCGFNELWKRPYKLSDQDRNRVLDRMVDILRIDPTIENEIIIESHEENLASWAELLAERVHARHFFIACNEVYRGDNKYYFENLDFFYFKHQRREIFISNNTIKKLFNGHRGLEKRSLEIPAGVNAGKEMDAIQDVKNPVIDRVASDDWLNIAYMGRTEKYYVPAVFEGVAEFSKNHPDKKIQFVIVGSLTRGYSKADRLELLKKLFTDSPNVIVHGLGNLVPIPRALFKKLDVVIAGAQTAVFCAYENVPVIATIVDSEKTAGCLYYDTNDAWNSESKYSFAKMLEKVLINREYDHRQINLPDRKPADWHYEKTLEIMRKSDQPFEYFTDKFKKDLRRNWYALFPFEQIPKNSRVVLYGENDVSFDYQKQMKDYCQLVGIVANNYEDFDRSILPPEKLTELDYDLIVIAEFPNQDRINKIAENIFRITGKKNFIYTWKFFEHE